MAALSLPPGGLELPPTPSMDVQKEKMTLPQIIRLNVENGMLYDLMRATRQGARKPQLSLGRNMSLHYGHQQRALVSTPAKFPAFLYERSEQHDACLQLVGEFTHGLDILRAEEDNLAGDSAVAELQSSLALKEQAKQSQQFVTILSFPQSDPADQERITVLPKSSQDSKATLTPGNTSTTLPRKGTAPSVFRKNALQSQSQPHSHPSSPAMAPAQVRPPGYPSETQQAQMQKEIRLQRLKAQRHAIIHLVARREVASTIIEEKVVLRSDQAKDLISKLCKPSKEDGEKMDLKDPSFKELDVWKFKYSSEDREVVIQRAIAAYDRMRISPNDEIFQRLLPPKDRNQGKSLSKLDHLNKGPVKPNNTPRIKVQQPEENMQNQDQGRGRKGKSDSTGSQSLKRARSQESIRRPKSATKETQAKKPTQTTSKKGQQDEKRKTLSTEFVQDSDDEDGLEQNEGAPAEPETVSVGQTMVAQANGDHSKTVNGTGSTKIDQISNANKHRPGAELVVHQSNKTVKGKPATSPVSTQPASSPGPHKADIENIGNGSIKRKAAETDLGSQPTTKKPRNLSSPRKPSPLGSSPPAIAVDAEMELSSSASSTPLISRIAEKAARAKDSGFTKGHDSKMSIKRRLDDIAGSDHKTSRPSNGEVNSHGRAVKQARSNIYTPPASDSPSPESQGLPQSVIDLSEKFRVKYYPKYKKVYLEVQEMEFPTEEKLEHLAKMQRRIEEVKQEIYDEYTKYKG